MIKKRSPIILAIGLLVISLIYFAVLFIRMKSFHPDKTLIVYFSRANNTTFSEDVDAISSASLRKNKDGKLAGNCEVVADYLQKISGADIFEITVSEKYPEDYEETVSIASSEVANNERPKLTKEIDDMSAYDNIILIYPVWWGTMPMPVFTFLEQYNMSNKHIYPIATHKGSFLGNSVNDIREMCPKAVIHSAVPISGGCVDYLWILPFVIIASCLLMVAGSILRYKTQIKAKWYLVGCGMIICGMILLCLCIIRLLL